MTPAPASDRDGAPAHFGLGQGPNATVLLHGFLGSGRNLRSLAQLWLERDPSRRFLVPDLRGHGDAPPLGPGDSLATLANDVLATTKAGGLHPPVRLVGHSLGGRVALVAADLEPALFDQVVVLDIGPGATPPALSESRRVLDVLLAAPEVASDRARMRAHLMEQGLSRPLADWLLMNLRPGAGGALTWRFDRQALADLHARFSAEDLWPLVERAEVPLHFIRGENSSYLSPRDAERLARLGCVVDTLPAAGHFVHVDAPGPLVDLLL